MDTVKHIICESTVLKVRCKSYLFGPLREAAALAKSPTKEANRDFKRSHDFKLAGIIVKVIGAFSKVLIARI